VYVSAGKNGRELDRESRPLCVYARARFKNGDKPPVLILADRGTGQWYVIPAKAADESTIRLLLADRQQESLTVYSLINSVKCPSAGI
jgi:transposase-like protein